MLFHTGSFAIFFLVYCLASVLIRLIRSKLPVNSHVYLTLVFSMFFYGWWSWKFLILLILTIFVDFFIAAKIGSAASSTRRKQLVTASVVINLGILGFFKYWNFFVSGLGEVGVPVVGSFSIENLVLPVGISFYVFQSISYTIDVYRGHLKPVKNIFEYACYVCYFPQLVAGPIERVEHLLPKLIKPERLTGQRVAVGFTLFAYGYYLKAVGDVLSQLHDPIFANLTQASPVNVVIAIFSFGAQIYCDFFGYTNMARGISATMGIDLIANFRSPYLAISLSDFWQRWHISLSQWLRDYLYISLGGNRKGLALQLRNLMITMILGGLWHGAGLNFIIWGLLHGFYLVVARIWNVYGLVLDFSKG